MGPWLAAASLYAAKDRRYLLVFDHLRVESLADAGVYIEILGFPDFPGTRLRAGFFALYMSDLVIEIVRRWKMAKADKAVAIEELSEKFKGSGAIVLTEYRGLSTGNLKELRRELGADVEYRVVKNTLAAIAAKQVGLEFLADDLKGPTAVAFIAGEPVVAAKVLRDYAKANPQLVLKSGAMDGVALSEEAVRKLADLESREVLLAKAAGVMKAKISQAAYMFQAMPVKVARLADALREKREEAA